jgi:hypothetical protein
MVLLPAKQVISPATFSPGQSSISISASSSVAEEGQAYMKIVAGVLLFLCLGAAPAGAVLGAYESSITSDQQYLRGEVRETTAPGYKFQQIISPSGAVIREYVSPEGKVFGVAWQSPYIPNLQQLLGSYVTLVQQAAQSRTRNHSAPLVVRTDDFVFSSGGHMRAFHGRAYVPSLLPKNVSAEVVR